MVHLMHEMRAPGDVKRIQQGYDQRDGAVAPHCAVGRGRRRRSRCCCRCRIYGAIAVGRIVAPARARRYIDASIARRYRIRCCEVRTSIVEVRIGRLACLLRYGRISMRSRNM